MEERQELEGIHRLSKEIILMIFDHLAAQPEEVPVDRRAWLSVASFRPPHAQSQQHDHDPKAVGNLRRTCKKFSRLGASCQFQRLAVRFSSQGIRRLEGIAERPHLARVVRKFTYMVPRLFEKGYANVEEYLRVTEPKGKSSKLQGVLDMAKDQLEVIASHQDVKAMNKAMLAFSSLQHVQLLRLQTELHFEFLHHLRRHPQAAERFVHFGWEWASLHVSRTVGCAFLRANSPATRLSSQFDVPSIITLMARHKCSTEELASRLECLSIRFESFEKEWYTSQLSKVFRHIFIASQHSMVSMHLGFPQEPVSISLEEVFLGVRMERLRVFSIDNWRLDGEMIIKVVRQYSNNLRGMRLRGVLLEPGSFWKDVLQDIRLNMSNLVWLSLRRVNYVKHFNEKNMGGSVDYSDDGAQSGSDIEDRWSDEEDSSGHLSDSESDYGTGSESEQDDPDGYEEDDDDSFEGNDNSSVADSNTGSDHEAIPNGHRVHFAIREGSIHGDREVFCTCKHPENFDSLESLRDDGEKVSKTQWKMWELWTLGGRGCAVHDGHDTSLPHTENI